VFDHKLLAEIPIDVWVALNADETRVVSHGPSLRNVLSDAALNGEPHPVIVGNPVRKSHYSSLFFSQSE
jgi:hypothetical protein